MADIAERMSNIKHKVLVLSGKGGVGKSTFSAQLSFALAHLGAEVSNYHIYHSITRIIKIIKYFFCYDIVLNYWW